MNESLELNIDNDEEPLITTTNSAGNSQKNPDNKDTFSENKRSNDPNLEKFHYLVDCIADDDYSLSEKRSLLIELSMKLKKDAAFSKCVFESSGLPYRVIETVLQQSSDVLTYTIFFQILNHLLNFELAQPNDSKTIKRDGVSAKLIKVISTSNDRKVCYPRLD
ncbi:unnamed protein product [Ambrosiozyma monospora]|uniref:Unnamed protein product n=1 Tax=Ambrosiozyma monospora TaxID=43982 RepID=A0ACB5TZ28_AMBMO|nr:unnamed protein product [Ambrosiozyma monospora]